MFGQGLKHSHKVLVLVLVPLLFQLSLMAVLYNLSQESEHEAQRAEHARTITLHINRFHQLMMSAAAGISGTAISTELLGAGAHNRMERSFLRELEEVEKCATPDSDESALVEQMKKCVVLSIADLTKIKETMKEGDLADRVSQLKVMKKLLAKVTEQSEKLLEFERRIEESSPKIQQERRDRIKQLLIIGAITNVLIVLSLLQAFNQSTTNRLKILQQNSVRLSAREQLIEPLSGVDEIAQVDQAFHQMADELASLEKMKQEFIAMVSHDLRTPLTSLKGVLSLISEGIVEPGTQTGQRRLKFADQSLDQLIKMITDLLDIEKLEAGMFTMEFTKCDMQNVIDSAVQSLYTFAEQNGVAIVSDTKETEVSMDGDRISQVILNLLSNAVKFSPRDSVVDIRCETHDGFAMVTVTDKGRGIAPENHKKVFERFKQVEAADAKRLSGSGLGLAICKKIIEAHHGEIGVDSELGEGSTFWFKIPLVASNVVSVPGRVD